MDIKNITFLLQKVREKCDYKYVGVEDLYLLVSLANYELTDVNKDLTWYLNSQLVYDPEEYNFIIPWKKRIEYLIRLNLLETPYGSFYRTSKEGQIIIEPSKLKVTEKFTKEIYIKNELKESLFELLLEQWGDEVFYGELYPSNLITNKNKEKNLETTEDLINLFWKKVNYGNSESVKIFFSNAKKLKEKYPALTLIKLIKEYEYLKKNIK